MNGTSSSQILLIVEDNPEDYEAITRAFKKAQLRNPIHWCKSGQEALDYLKRDASTKGTLPGLMLLDLNMPGIDGHKILQVVKQDKELKSIPVIILTTSGNDQDIESSFKEGANSYVQKPVTFEGMISAIKGLKEYWFEISILPKENEAEK